MHENIDTVAGTPQQCWECKRRDLACDGAVACGQCKSAAIVCPGYADKKPLVWLAPGHVSRRKKRNASRLPKHKEKTSNHVNRGSEAKALVISPKQSTTSSVREKHGPPQTYVKEYQRAISRMNPPKELRDDGWDFVEAFVYYNDRLYPQCIQQQLEPSPFVVKLSGPNLIPPSIAHTLVSVVLARRIYQASRGDLHDTSFSPLWERLYHHRDVAIRSLNKLVGDEKTRYSLLTIGSVYTFLIAVLQQAITPHWRQHFDGYLKLISHIGGASAFLDTSPIMVTLILPILTVGVIANTTSPAQEQIRDSFCSGEEAHTMTDRIYSKVFYPSFNCPTALFKSIISINDLRFQTATDSHAVSLELDLSTLQITSGRAELNTSLCPIKPQEAAENLLIHIETFSPEDFALTRPAANRKKWLLIAQIYRSAVALYCILSLQSVSLLPKDTPEMEIARARHARELLVSLEKGLEVPQIKYTMIWPLTVAGVEAVRSVGSGPRVFIQDLLTEMCAELGASSPLVAREALRRFWGSGKTTWDECFDWPYAFVI